MLGEDILKKVVDKSSEESYTSIPDNYVSGKIKYIVVTGSVMSGSGKGIFASSLAKLLQYAGLKVSPIKIDGYLNQDAGTLNPFRHGEVFVLDDGMECDMDLGSYERFMDKNLCKENYLTAGMIFNRILKKERAGDYLGRDVQFVHHVTGEIKWILRDLGMKQKANIVLVEVGGTIGDFENAYVIEAMRQLSYEEGKENVCFINLNYIVEPSSLGEQKSKPAQLGLERLRAFGIQPHLMICRAERPVSQSIKEKLSAYSNVNIENVVGLHNTPTVYEAPLLLKDLKVDEKVMRILGLYRTFSIMRQKKELIQWKDFVTRYKSTEKKVVIGIAGKYTGLNDSYASILKALEHAATKNGAKVKIKYIETTKIEDGDLDIKQALSDVDGLVVPGGFGKRGTEGKIKCIKYVRENNIPFLGLCFGFQMAVIEFIRNKCGLMGGHSTEIEPRCGYPVIDILPEQKKIEGLGGNMRLGGQDVSVKQGTKAYSLYGGDVRLRFRHRYEVNPKYIELIEKNGMVFSGKSPNYPIMQILELPNLKFFMATQAHPEFNSRPLKPEPLFNEFMKNCI